MSDKLDKLLDELDSDDIKILLDKLSDRLPKPPDNPIKSSDGVIRLDSQQDSPQPTTQKRTLHINRPVNTSGPRPNKFFDMPEAEMYKSDSRLDKKLWEETNPSPRRDQASKYAIHCSRCNQEYILSSLQGISKDTETGKYMYVCDNCIPRIS